MNKKTPNRLWSLSLALALSLGLTVALLSALSSSNMPIVMAGRPARPLFAPVPTGTAPTANALNVPITVEVSITFDEPISLTSVTSRTFAVYGSQSSIFTGAYTLRDISRTLVFTPSSLFFPGERVDASVTTATLNITGEQAISPTVWQFWAEVFGGSGQFADSGQRLGNRDSYGVALGDLDGDSDLDAFVANSGAQTNTIWLNDGSGVFTTGFQFPSAASSYAVALGDIDGDGDMDAFVANSTGNKVWINDGTGAFSDSTQLLGSSDSYDVALGDIDGDGDLDAVVANGVGAIADEVWRNDGSGTFTDTGQTLSILDTHALALGDLDNDGDLDIFEANYNAGNTVWFNDSTGVFTDSGQSLGTYSSEDVALGDLDGDGDLDAVVANSGASDSNTIWLNNGNGGFSAIQSIGFQATYAVALGDADGDGDLDIFFGRDPQDNEIWLNDGSCNFSQAQVIADGSYTHDAAFGDLNGNGKLDLYVANISGQANVVWMNRSRVLTVSPPPNVHDAPVSTNLTVTADSPFSQTTASASTFVVHGGFHGKVGGTFIPGSIVFQPGMPFFPGELVETSVTSGVLDIADLPLIPYVWRFRTAAGAGGGTLSNTQQLNNLDSYDVAFGDLDGDSDLDAVVVSPSTTDTIWLNNGAGVFTVSTRTLNSGNSWSVALGDVDNDSDLDAITASPAQSGTVWLNDGTGNFTAAQAISFTAAVVLLGDMDGDGDLDVYGGAYSSGIAHALWWNDGNGLFTDSLQTLSISGTVGAALGDLDHDGDLDLFLAHENPGLGVPNTVWLNDGHGMFQDSGQRLGNMDSNDVALGDLDGDGDLDAVVANFGPTEPAQVWLNTGGGVFTTGQSLGQQNVGVALGDIDGDADLDIIFAQGGQYTNTVWLNDGTGMFAQTQELDVNVYSRRVAVGDLDKDGDLDAMIVNTGVESNTVWLNQAGAASGVNTTVDDNILNGNCTLREAIIAANSDEGVDLCPPGSGPDTITLAAGIYTLAVAGTDEDDAATGDLDITAPLTITGAGYDQTFIDADGIDRVFDIFPSAGTVVISGVTIVSGSVNGNGGGIRTGGTQLMLINTYVSNNTANNSSYGGGVHIISGSVTLNDGSIDGNSASKGGGVYVEGSDALFTLQGGWIFGNETDGGGGGGVYVEYGKARLIGGDIVSNSTYLGDG